MAKKQDTVQPAQGTEFDSLIAQYGEYTDADAPDPGYDPDAYKEQKQQEKEAAYQLIDDTADQVCADPRLLQAYLDVQSRFLDNSSNNGLLIYAQRPGTTLFHTSQEWKKMNRHPKAGEKGFMVLARGGQYASQSGGVGYYVKVAKVFDFAQTQGKDLPARGRRTAQDEKAIFRAMVQSKPVEVELRPPEELEGLSGLYVSKEAKIYLAKGLDGNTIIRTLAEEFAHANMDDGTGSYDRGSCSVPACCASYLFCKRFRLNTEGFDFSKAPGYFENMDSRTKSGVLNTIRLLAQFEEKGVVKYLQPEQAPAIPAIRRR